MEQLTKPTILVVDDIEWNIQIIVAMSKGLEVNFITATSGELALELIKGKELALALIDMEMPVMDGQELARRLHADTTRDLVPIIFVTAHSVHELHLEKYYQLGIIDFIIKPFHPNILLGKVRILLELFHQKQIIRASEQMYRMLLDASPEGIIIMRPDGIITEISSQVKTLFGIVDKSNFTGHPLHVLFPREEQVRVEELIGTTLEQGITRNMEFTLHRSDQQQFAAEISTTLIPGDSGETRLLMAIIRDITERKKLEQQLIHTERLAGLGELAAGIAHEINQPLNTISIGLENLLHEVFRNRLNHDYLRKKADKIFENISRIDHIIDHIRTFSRSRDLDFSTLFSLNESVTNAVSMIAAQLRHKGIELLTELAPGLPPVMGNTYKFEQVILNLLINAKDAIEEYQSSGGVSRHGLITLKSFQEEGQCVVEVNDNGIGIPADSVDKIMLPFHTTKEAGKGTGLGLSISFGIVREMKGEITVSSTFQSGTTIRIEVPEAKQK